MQGHICCRRVLWGQLSSEGTGEKKADQPDPICPTDLALSAASSRGPDPSSLAQSGKVRQCPAGTMEMAPSGAAPKEVFVPPNFRLQVQTILNVLKGFRKTIFLEVLVTVLPVS